MPLYQMNPVIENLLQTGSNQKALEKINDGYRDYTNLPFWLCYRTLDTLSCHVWLRNSCSKILVLFRG